MPEQDSNMPDRPEDDLASGTDTTSPTISDAHHQDELRAWVRRAAADTPQFPVFLQRLVERGVRLDATVSRSGRVTGLGYVCGGTTTKASTLGPEFTWSGLQRKFGVYFIPQRDREVLEAHLAGETLPLASEPSQADTTAPEQETLPFSAGASATPETSLQSAAEPAISLPPIGVGGTAAIVPSVALAVMAETAEPEEHVVTPHAEHTATTGAERVEPDSGPSALPAALAELTARVERLQAQLRERDERFDQELQRLVSQVAAVGAGLTGEGATPPLRDDVLLGKISQAEISMREARDAVLRGRQEALWLTVTGGVVAGLVIVLLLGLWLSQSVENSSAQARDAVIEHMDKQAAEDPLRKYFDRIVKKLQ